MEGEGGGEEQNEEVDCETPSTAMRCGDEVPVKKTHKMNMSSR